MSEILEELDGAMASVHSLRAKRDALAVRMWEQGVSQYVIADRLGLSQPYISRLVCRDRRARIAAAMQLVPPGAPPNMQNETTTKGEEL